MRTAGEILVYVPDCIVEDTSPYPRGAWIGSPAFNSLYVDPGL